MISKKLIFILIILNIFFISGCQRLIDEKINYIDPTIEGLSETVKEALLKNKKLILSLGTGLCENCIIVHKTLEEFEKEKPNNLEVLIFTDYTDIKTFQILGVTISPITLLIDEKHKVLRRIIGPFTISELKKYLQEVDWEKY